MWSKSNQHRYARGLRFERLFAREMLAANPLIGVNVDPVVDYGTAWTFTDAFISSRPWISHGYNTVTGVESFNGGGEVHIDANGWPTKLNVFVNDRGETIQQRLGTLMFRDIGDKYPEGTYRAEWQGTGTVTWSLAASVVESGVEADGTNYALLDVTPQDDGIYMRIESMDVDDPIRDVHVWMPDFEGQSFWGQVWEPGSTFSPFHPAYLESLEPFSMLRFMEWADTNRTTLVDWADRRSYDYARQTGEQRGVAYEYMIELANTLQKDIWLNMPHQATDDFVNNFAKLVRDSLDPDLRVYIEYSNEVWNNHFDAYHWITEKLPNGDNSQRYKIVAQEAVRDFDIWSNIFAGQEDRLIRVASAFTEVPTITDSILRNMQGKFDAIEVGSYFRLTNADRNGFDETTTVDDILDVAAHNMQAITFDRIEKHQALAETYSAQLGREIDLIVYEGGQLLLPQSNQSPYLDEIYAAQTHPRMFDLYQDLISGLAERGVDVFGHFTHINKLTTNSTTGALQYQLQPIEDAPKYQALVAAANAANEETVSLTASQQTISVTEETNAYANLSFHADAVNQATSVSISVTGLTATAGQDYAGVEYSLDDGKTWTQSTEFVLPRNAISFMVRVGIIDDIIVEPLESFRVTASTSTSTASTDIKITSLDIDDQPSGPHGLVAHWDFDNDDRLVMDRAGLGMVDDHGNLIGNAALVDHADMATVLWLGGNGDRVHVPSSRDINTGIFPERTVALNFYADDVSRRQVLFEEGGTTRGLIVYIENGELVVGGWNASSMQSNWSGTWLRAPIASGRWHHVAIVLDGSTETLPNSFFGYLDGQMFGSGMGSQLWSHTDPIGIGGANSETRFAPRVDTQSSIAAVVGPDPTPSTNTDFRGFIDDVRVYNQVLSSSEIATLASSMPIADITISDASATEGDDLLFELSISQSLEVPVTLDLSLHPVTAEYQDFGTPSVDGLATLENGRLQIPAFTTQLTIRVPTIIDSIAEDSESFRLDVAIIDGPIASIEPATGLIHDGDPIGGGPRGDDPVALWQFNQDNRGTISDDASSGVHSDIAALTNNAVIDAQWGREGAVALDGKSLVAISSSTDINLSTLTHRTVSLWFYALDTSDKQILYEEGATTTGLNIYLESGQLYVGGWHLSGASMGWTGTWHTAAVEENRWNHVALVLDTGSRQPGTFQAFLNGTLFGSGEGYAMTQHSDPIGIGASNGGARFANNVSFASNTNPFAGYIDEVSVLNRSLSGTEIANIAAAASQFSTGTRSSRKRLNLLTVVDRQLANMVTPKNESRSAYAETIDAVMLTKVHTPRSLPIGGFAMPDSPYVRADPVGRGPQVSRLPVHASIDAVMSCTYVLETDIAITQMSSLF